MKEIVEQFKVKIKERGGEFNSAPLRVNTVYGENLYGFIGEVFFDIAFKETLEESYVLIASTTESKTWFYNIIRQISKDLKIINTGSKGWYKRLK